VRDSSVTEKERAKVFSVIYNGFRPTTDVTFISAEIFPERGSSDYQKLNGAEKTIVGSSVMKYSDHLAITSVNPYQVVLGDEGAKEILIDFLNLSSAIIQNQNKKERVQEYVSKYGFPTRPRVSSVSDQPNLEERLEDIVESVKSFRRLYNIKLTENDVHLVNPKEIIDIVNRTISAASTKIEMTLSDSGAIVPRIVAGNIFVFCIFNALSALQENTPFVTCANCGKFYQRGRTAKKNAAYCGDRCRQAAYRRKKYQKNAEITSTVTTM
jgi:hypothetical protein